MTRRPIGVTALSAFFVFGALMSGLTAIMLLTPGSALDSLWRLNPRAQEEFAAIGNAAVALMFAVCAACLVGAIGLWRCRRFGYWIALSILTINLVGDTANYFFAHDWRTLIGLPVAGLMIGYLISNRGAFA